MHRSYKYVVDQAENNKQLNEKFTSHALSFIETTQNKSFINVDSVERGFKLLEFFNKNKLILAEYENNDWSADFFAILDSLINKKIPAESNNLVRSITKFCLLLQKRKFSCNEVNKKFSKSNADMVKNIFMKLESFNIGTCVTESRRSLHFEKTNLNYIEDLNIIKFFEENEVNVMEFVAVNNKIFQTDSGR